MRVSRTSLRRALGRRSALKDLPAQAREAKTGRTTVIMMKKELDTQMTPAQKMKKSPTRRR